MNKFCRSCPRRTRSCPGSCASTRAPSAPAGPGRPPRSPQRSTTASCRCGFSCATEARPGFWSSWNKNRNLVGENWTVLVNFYKIFVQNLKILLLMLTILKMQPRGDITSLKNRKSLLNLQTWAVFFSIRIFRVTRFFLVLEIFYPALNRIVNYYLLYLLIDDLLFSKQKTFLSNFSFPWLTKYWKLEIWIHIGKLKLILYFYKTTMHGFRKFCRKKIFL